MTALRCLTFPGTAPASVAIVLLPGAYTGPDDAVDAGFPAALHAHAPHASLFLPELPVGDLRERDGLDTLREQVIGPARAAGMRVWLAGISLGGYFSLLYAGRWASDLAGLMLLAPYLGNRGLSGIIDAAGGASAWLQDSRELDAAVGTEEERSVWRLLAQPPGMPLYMGYGSDDRFARSHRLAAELLPPGHVTVVPGGHDWRTWLDIWKHLLPCLDR